MREHKFRGFSETNNCWVYGLLLRPNDDERSIIVKEFSVNTMHLECFFVVPESVGQFTGLICDEGLAPIFEGDILRHVDFENAERRYYVKYCGDLNEGLGMPLCGYYLQRDDFESWMELENRSDYEVIGNIFEDSLAKQKQ